MRFYDLNFFVDFPVKVYDYDGVLLYSGDYFKIPQPLFSDLSRRIVEYVSIGHVCFYITLKKTGISKKEV